jgi:hypothetical protein
VDAGQFKPAFGKEFLYTEARLPFVYRSAAAVAINPGRQRGVQLTGTGLDGRVSAFAGVFSGNGITSTSDPKLSLFTGKVRIVPLEQTVGSNTLQTELSGSALYTEDNADISAIQLIADNRFIFNGQIRISCGNLWTEAEYANASSNNVRTTNSLYCDLGWKIDPGVELIGRFDWKMNYWNYDSTARVFNRIPDGICRKYILGTNWYPATELKIQLNYERDQTYRWNSAYLNVQYSINDQ